MNTTTGGTNKLTSSDCHNLNQVLKQLPFPILRTHFPSRAHWSPHAIARPDYSHTAQYCGSSLALALYEQHHSSAICLSQFSLAYAVIT